MLKVFPPVDFIPAADASSSTSSSASSSGSGSLEFTGHRVNVLLDKVKELTEQKDVLEAERDDYLLQYREQFDLVQQLNEDQNALIDDVTSKTDAIAALEAELTRLRTQVSSSPSGSSEHSTPSFTTAPNDGAVAAELAKVQKERQELEDALVETETSLRTNEQRVQLVCLG